MVVMKSLWALPEFNLIYNYLLFVFEIEYC
jgi:hypothetical protein